MKTILNLTYPRIFLLGIIHLRREIFMTGTTGALLLVTDLLHILLRLLEGQGVLRYRLVEVMSLIVHRGVC